MPRLPMMNWVKNVMLKPMKTRAQQMRAELLVVHAAGHLRPPVVQAAEERDHRAAHHHVVEVGDDEVGVVQVDVDARACRGTGRSGRRWRTATGTRARTASARSSVMAPLYMVASQLNTLIAGRDGDQEGQEREDHAGELRLARDEHVVAPDEEADAARWRRDEKAMDV